MAERPEVGKLFQGKIQEEWTFHEDETLGDLDEFLRHLVCFSVFSDFSKIFFLKHIFVIGFPCFFLKGLLGNMLFVFLESLSKIKSRKAELGNLRYVVFWEVCRKRLARKFLCTFRP